MLWSAVVIAKTQQCRGLFTVVLIRVSVLVARKGETMDQFRFRFRELWFFWLVFLFSSNGLWAAEPRVQILSPKDGSRITQEQNSVLISGKVATDLGRSPNVDIVFVIDISGSTSQYAGADFGDMGPLA